MIPRGVPHTSMLAPSLLLGAALLCVAATSALLVLSYLSTGVAAAAPPCGTWRNDTATWRCDPPICPKAMCPSGMRQTCGLESPTSTACVCTNCTYNKDKCACEGTCQFNHTCTHIVGRRSKTEAGDYAALYTQYSEPGEALDADDPDDPADMAHNLCVCMPPRPPPVPHGCGAFVGDTSTFLCDPPTCSGANCTSGSSLCALVADPATFGITLGDDADADAGMTVDANGFGHHKTRDRWLAHNATCACTTCAYNATLAACVGTCPFSFGCNVTLAGNASLSLAPRCGCVRLPTPPPAPTPRPTPKPTVAPWTTAPREHDNTPCCGEPLVLDIVEYTNVRVTQLANCSYSFEVDVNFERDTANIVSFWPLAACPVRNRTSCDNVASNFTGTYCDFFNVNRKNWPTKRHLFSANGWSAALMEPHTSKPFTRFSRNFTLDELVACGGVVPRVAPDGDLLYEGTLYVGAVHASNCSLMDALGDNSTTLGGGCQGCDLRFSQPYEFAIDYASNGTLTLDLASKRVGFTIRWVKNVELPGGDMLVVLETCVGQLSDTFATNGTLTRLVAPRADGVPEDDDPNDGASLLNVLDYTDCELPLSAHGGRCCQRVNLGSHNVSASQFDFSGDRYLSFDVEDSDHTKHGSVHAYLELDIKRGARQQRFTAESEAEAQLFRDRALTELYELNSHHHSTFLDCEEACVLVTVPCPPGVHVALDAAELCTSDTADPAPFDPENPGTTGCNTPSIGLRVYDLFDRSENFTSAGFNVSLSAADAALKSYQAAFCFKVHTLSCRSQLLQIHYHLLLADGSHARNVRDMWRSEQELAAASRSRQLLSLEVGQGTYARARRAMGASPMARRTVDGAPAHHEFSRESALDNDETRLGSRFTVTCPPSQRYFESAHRCVDLFTGASWWGDGDRDGDGGAWWAPLSENAFMFAFFCVFVVLCACGTCVYAFGGSSYRYQEATLAASGGMPAPRRRAKMSMHEETVSVAVSAATTTSGARWRGQAASSQGASGSSGGSVKRRPAGNAQLVGALVIGAPPPMAQAQGAAARQSYATQEVNYDVDLKT